MSWKTLICPCELSWRLVARDLATHLLYEKCLCDLSDYDTYIDSEGMSLDISRSHIVLSVDTAFQALEVLLRNLSGCSN